VGIRIERLDNIHAQIESLINNREKIKNMQQEARRLGKPDSAIETARLILNTHV